MGLPKFSLRSLKARTVQNKFNIIISLILLILVFGLLSFWFSMKIMAGIRSYVGGEGLWSKSQKEAANQLIKYSDSKNEADYQRYQQFIRVPLGDKQARLELNKPHPSLAIARQGFIRGGNNPGDVNDMIFLYRHFRRVSYISSAIETWTEGDQEITTLRNEADQLHQLVSSRQLDPGSVKALQNQIYDTDKRLTVLENRFSATLGDGSRNTAHILLRVTLLSTILLGALTLVIALWIARAIIRLDRLKSEFVSIASHQLRTPLTVVNWYAETLLSESRGKLSALQKQELQELYNGGQRMASLITDLLRVSSLDLGTYHSEIKAVSIKDIVETVSKDQQLELGRKHIALSTTIDPALHKKIKLDEQLLSVIFQNLVSNSVKYTPENGWVKVAVKAATPNLLISVQDNGIGIPKSQQDQIFSKFFRAENVTALSGSDGTGLGLYIVKAMVEHLHGGIWFESVENNGTTFYVKLPIYGGGDRA